ncbi:MAG: fused MFS/spermidine synthase, partial [Planctomycetes bacterium]|nr:fused MFS/spermidine synthase [Planctomycetota bacterium]
VFLRHATRRWHVIHVDAYAHQVYVPAHLASREFFELAHARLEPGGVLACNVGALRPDDPVLAAIAVTMGRSFGSVLALPVPNSRNVLLVGRRDAALAPERLTAASTTSAALLPDDAARWRSLLAHAADRAKWRSIAGDRVLVDDRPELDELLLAGYLADDDPGEVVACAGPASATTAELDAYAARQRLDWQAVLQHVQSSATATSFLRELAGDARWALRHLRAADAEYASALASSPDAAARQRLERNLGFVREDLQRIEAARACSARNGWLLAVSLLSVGLLGIAWLRSAGGPAAA